MTKSLNHLLQDARIWQGHKPRKHTSPAEHTGYQVLDNQLGGLGWPKGALSECLLDHHGIGELHLALPLMRNLARQGKTIFWLNPPHMPYAPALASAGVPTDQLVLIQAKDSADFLWTLENCLRSPVTGLVMAWPGQLASRDIRRLQLASEAGNNVCILFRKRQQADQSSPAALRMELAPGACLDMNVHILKRRGSWPGQRCTIALAHRAGTQAAESTQVVQGPWPKGGST